MKLEVLFGWRNDGLPAILTNVKTQLGKIIMSNAQIAAEVRANNAKIDGLTNQVGKVGNEIQTLIAKLGQTDDDTDVIAALGEQAASLVTLGAAVKGADDLNEDGTPVEPDPAEGGDVASAKAS